MNTSIKHLSSGLAVKNPIFVSFFLFALGIAIVIALFPQVENPIKFPTVIAAQESKVPEPPTSRADRFGIYNWNINDAAFPGDGSTDRLNWGAAKVAEMGVRTIRIALTARDIYLVNPQGKPDLTQIAQSPAFDKLLRDPRFQTIMITAYTRGDMANNWADGFTQAEYNAERDEIKKLGEYLLGNSAFANKTFIILNWESDNAIYYHANKRVVWDYFTNWIRARAEGVKLARQSAPSSNAHLFSGLEFNTVKGINTGQDCGHPIADPIRNDPLGNRCVIDYVAPNVDVDYYSYSAWSSIEFKLNQPDIGLKNGIKSDLEFALKKVREKRPEVTAHNFILGEYGFDRTRHGECYAANFVNEMFDVFEGPDAFPVSYVIYWQIIDNSRAYGAQGGHFGLFRPRDNTLNLTLLGETFKKRIAGQQATVYTGCPRIRRHPPEWGVINQEGNTDFRLNPDAVGSIYVPNCCQNTDSPFSSSGNVTHFDQNVGQFLLPRDNATWWYESQTQINFSLPPARRPGWALIYVTDSRGIDTNGQAIALTCQDCPQINTDCGIHDAVYQTLRIEPGSVITISGASFSPSGNSVIIEQRETSAKTRRWTSPRANILLESATQINLKLPDDLVPNRDTMIYVVNGQGRESNEVTLSISEPCENCEPRLKPCQAIVGENGGSLGAGSVATINGRFAASGNQVIIEQVDQQNRVYQHTISQGISGWEETDKRIRFVLPQSLFAGRALIYLIDPQGPESRAKEITISPTPVTSVSAANYLNQKLAAASIAAAFGAGMATTTQSASSTPLPTEIDGTHISIKDNAGVERNAPLFFVSPTQINFQIPAGSSIGPATITVFNGFGSSSEGAFQIVNVAAGLFTADASGKGVAAAVAVRVKANGALIYEPVAVFDQILNQFVATPIDLGPPDEQVFIVLFGTGLRGRSSLSAVLATIGGITSEVVYAGLQSEFVGLDQINLRLSRNLAGRGEVDVAVSIDGISLNIVKMKVK